ncbi:MAG: hypothetical protein HOC23_00860 [Halieaceae bacterium]|jgi:hypothetical protein|nr:hypothetical protein [Halieaceae bacterium]
MKIVHALALGLFLSSTTTMAECVSPDAPELPSGADSTMDDMLGGQKMVKTYQAANIEYMKCLEAIISEADAAIAQGTEEEQAAAHATHSEATESYNAAVSAEESVAGQFNTEIRAYKAANPG